MGGREGKGGEGSGRGMGVGRGEGEGRKGLLAKGQHDKLSGTAVPSGLPGSRKPSEDKHDLEMARTGEDLLKCLAGWTH